MVGFELAEEGQRKQVGKFSSLLLAYVAISFFQQARKHLLSILQNVSNAVLAHMSSGYLPSRLGLDVFFPSQLLSPYSSFSWLWKAIWISHLAPTESSLAAALLAVTKGKVLVLAVISCW